MIIKNCGCHSDIIKDECLMIDLMKHVYKKADLSQIDRVCICYSYKIDKA